MFIVPRPSLAAGPAESLFKKSYYQLMKTALKEDGILCCQGEYLEQSGESGAGPAWHANADVASPPGECQWLHLDLIKDMQHFCRSLFPVVSYAYCTIPTYPSGQIGFMLCSKNPVSSWQS